MDQLAVNCGIEGHALDIDCSTLDITAAPLPDDISIVVVDSGIKHALANGEYAKRKADCETAAAALDVATLRETDLATVEAARAKLGERVFRRARHVVTEIARVREFRAALDARDTTSAGRLMAESHSSLRDDYEVGCVELDALVVLADELGAIGSRMTGGGFGGSTVNLVSATAASAFAEQIVARYREQHGGAIEAFIVKPVAGASRELADSK
jgi:galactokinase